MSYNIIDILLVAITVFILTYSFFRGFIKRMSWSFATAGSLIISGIASKYVNDYLMFTENLNKIIVFVILFVVVLIILKIILNLISKSIKDKAVLGTADKLLGLTVGLLQSGAITVLISIVAFYAFKEFSSDSIIVNFVANLLNLRG